jgi:hypothetical protein
LACGLGGSGPRLDRPIALGQWWSACGNGGDPGAGGKANCSPQEPGSKRGRGPDWVPTILFKSTSPVIKGPPKRPPTS